LDGLEEHLQASFPPILLLMNINGLLVHRTSQRVEFIKSEGWRVERFVEFFKLKAQYHYFREGNLNFLKAIMSHPRVHFAFYSTIMRKNIMPIITNMFEKDKLLFKEHMMVLFDQEYNSPAPDVTGEKWG
jgi:hypothetical protein